MRRRLRALRDEWEDLAAVDPLWAVLTHPEGKGGAWEHERFFADGERHVAAVMAIAEELGLPRRRGAALDFGCGAGRATRALATRFDRVLGLDLSERLVATARELNGGVPNVGFEVNATEDLARLADGSFDLVHCVLVLQHQPDDAAIERYVAEFVRVAGDGALVVFQLPERLPWRHRIQPRRRAYALLRRAGLPAAALYRRGLDPLRMRAVAPSEVEAMVARAGGIVLRAVPDALGGAFPSATYYVTSR